MTARWRHSARFNVGRYSEGAISARADDGLDGVAISVYIPSANIHARVTLAELAGLADMFAKALASASADAADAELQKEASNDAA